MPLSQNAVLSRALFVCLFLLTAATAELEAKSDRKTFRKFSGNYTGQWILEGVPLPLRMPMPKAPRGSGQGIFEVTPNNLYDGVSPLKVVILRSKLSRNGKKLIRNGIILWDRSLLPQFGGSAESGSFTLTTKLVKNTPRGVGRMTLGTRDGVIQIQVRGKLPTVRTPWMEFVPVGNPNFQNDPTDGDALTGGTQNFGAVAYDFQIGKYEVTNAQYVAFLNAIAATDTYSLYETEMGSDPRSGITRSGSSGSYTYTLKEALWANKPANSISFWDACRFCNWLHNGRPSGLQGADTTENGAYDLTLPNVVANNTATRKPNAKYFLPSEHEWYKASFHQPAAFGGDSDDYWLYGTGSNTVPARATADSSGNIDNDINNIANMNRGADWNGQDGNVTTVGSGGIGSKSFYGAFDISGNVWEWNESIIDTADRGLRGGALWTVPSRLQSSERNSEPATFGDAGIGFRVAAPYPQ